MQNINLYAYGRATVNNAWPTMQNLIVNRLYYVNSGSALIHNANREQTLVKGRIYIIPQCHNFKPLDAFSFDHTFFDYFSLRVLDPNKIIEIDASVFALDRFFDYINKLIEQDPEQNNHKAIEQILTGILSVIDRQYTPLIHITNTTVMRAIDIIYESYANITTKALAQRLNINESHFIRLFHSTMGISPMKYIRACRVLNGKELIYGGASVAEAAEKCGYSSQSSFYKAVKMCLSQSPSDFKKQKNKLSYILRNLETIGKQMPLGLCGQQGSQENSPPWLPKIFLL